MIINNELFKIKDSEIPKIPIEFSEESRAWWSEQKLRAIEGYSVGGKWMPGPLYFYINFGTILLNKGENSKTKIPAKPFLRDIEWEFFYAWAVARGLSGFLKIGQLGLTPEEVLGNIKYLGTEPGTPIYEHQAKDLMMMGPREYGKELSNNEDVIIFNGCKKICDIKVGDLVATPYGIYSKVIGVYPQGLKDIYKFTFIDGRTIEAGLEHLWGLYDNSNYRIISTKQLLNKKLFNIHKRSGKTYRYFLPEVNAVEFLKKEYKIHPYVLGALLGDGGLNHGSPKIASDDIEIIDKFKKLLPDYGFKKDTTNNNYNISYKGEDKFSKEYPQGHNPLTRYIKELNLNVHGDLKFIPEEYKYGSIEQRYELVRGLLDTDGSINNDGSIEFTNKTKKLIDDLAWILRSLGIQCRIGVDNREGKTVKMPQETDFIMGKYYRLYIKTDKPVFYLSRKLNKIKPRKRSNKVSLISIEKLPNKEECTCITIEDDRGMFLTTNFIPTHNSYMASQGVILHEWLFNGAKTYEPGKVETTNIIVGAGDLRYATDLNSKTKLGYDYLSKAGIMFGDRYYPHPFYQAYDGSFSKEITAQYKKKVGGKWLEYGSKSKIKVVSYKDNPYAGQGSRNSVMVSEEIGMHKGLIKAQEADLETMRQGTQKFGSKLFIGTGGSMEGGTLDAYRMFYDPITYDLLSFEDIWEGKGKIAMFISATKRPNQFKDENGNTNEEDATAYFLKERERLRNSKNGTQALNAHIQYNPLLPSEIFLRSSGNIFPTTELKTWLAELETNNIYRDAEMICDLVFDDNGNVICVQDKSLQPIQEFPLRGNVNMDTSGAIVIWSHPVTDDSGNVQWGRYLAGCLLPGEKVLTNRGLINVENVNIDDKLINEHGFLVSINKLLNYNLINEDTYTLSMVNTFRTTTFTSEHPILISKSKYKQNYKSNHPKYKFNECYWEHDFNYITVDKASTNDWIKIPNIYRKINDYNLNDLWNNDDYRIDRQIESPMYNEDFWWFIGLWLGDGWCEYDEYKISVSFNISEQYYINKFKNIVNNLFNREVSETQNSDNCIELSFSFRQLSRFLTNNFGKYTDGKYIPEWCKYIRHDNKTSLLLGYLASDGCITKHTKGYYSMEFVSINLELLESIQDIFFSIGFISNLTKLRNEKTIQIGNNKNLSHTKKCYHLRFGNDDTINFVKNNYNDNDCKLSRVDLSVNIATENRRKQWCYFDDDNLDYIYIRIKEITKSKYTGVVYNFECETNTFMCHHITTHNCDPYAQEDANRGKSLGSLQVFDKIANTIVAEYTGRPTTLNEFYERCRKLLIYYNAQCLYENQILGMKQHFEHKNSLQYLMFQPQYIKDIIPGSKVDRGYGMHMVEQLRDHGLLLIRDWLQDEYEPGKLNLRKIRSIPLLQELILFDFDTNVDRISALIMVMYALKEKHKDIVEENKVHKIDSFFERRLYKKR